MTYPVSITITIAELDNGVLISTNPGELYALGDSASRSAYAPSIEDAARDLNEIVKAAWGRAKERSARHEHEHTSMVAEKQRVYYRDQTRPENDPGSHKLPEEAAVSAEPIPVVDETEANDAFLRDRPVVDTSAFKPEI